MPIGYIGRPILASLPLVGLLSLYGFEEFRMPFEVGPLRLREEPVSAEVVSLGLEREFLPAPPPIRAPDTETEARVLLRVLIGFRLLADGIDAQAGLMGLERPPCPRAGAWGLRDVFAENLLAENFPGVRGIVLPKVCAVPESEIEEVDARPELLLVILAVASPAISGP
jgi:hypothetical protein